MSAYTVYAFGAVALFCIGLYGVIVRRHLVRKIIALNIMGSGVFMLLVAYSRRVPDIAPDPVPHAMVLTGIVVAFGASTFALALAVRIHRATGRATLDRGEPVSRQ
jgi:multicomponent Na+:H+ antiporter subunit C